MRFFLTLLLFLANISIGCSSDGSKPPADIELQLIATYPLDIQEPSGLSIDNGHQYLWTVSDQHKKIYQITHEGERVTSFDCDSQDLEGIAQHPVDSSLYVVGESKGEVVRISINGEEIERFKIETESADPTSLEGITINSDGSRIYILNKVNPRLLFELDSEYNILNEYQLHFSEDCSGIVFDKDDNCLWIISDASMSLTKCTLQGIPLANYQLDFRKPEGIALDLQLRQIFVVSDSEEKLYIYSLPR